MGNRRVLFGLQVIFFACLAVVLTSCGDDESFSPVSKNRGYDYAYTSAKDLSKTPCDEMREGREAVIGRDKDRYECKFDYRDSVYIWVGYYDTLTAEGREFHRAESSSSEDDEYSSGSRSSSSSSLQSQTIKVRLTQKGEQFNPDIEYGTMTDPRDGNTYKTVVVDGLTWMAENLNYRGNEIGDELCYDGDTDLCRLYGRLYTRSAAMNSESCEYDEYCSFSSDSVQGICPDGWRIPTRAEGISLRNLTDNNVKLLMSEKGWTASLPYVPGNDYYGLSFVAGGDYEVNESYGYFGEAAFMWVYYEAINQFYFVINAKEGNVIDKEYSRNKLYLSVRCVKGKVKANSSIVSSSSVSSSSRSSSSVSSSSVSSSSMSSSSSSLPTTFSSMAIPFFVDSKEAFFNPSVDYGTLVDERDGKTYKTVTIGDAVWMAENLNFADVDAYPILEGHSFCFNNQEANCDLMGRLYDRPAAMNSASCDFKKYCDLGDTAVRGLCPAGWHIPTLREAEDLLTFMDADFSAMASSKGWESNTLGSNTSGFSLVGSGNLSGDRFVHAGELAMVWYYFIDTIQWYLVLENGKSHLQDYTNEREYVSIRCVMD